MKTILLHVARILFVPRFSLQIRRCTLALLCSATITGCASTAFRPVSEENKSQSNSFDGQWMVTIQKAAGTQYGPGNWAYNCSGEPGEFPLSVQDSVIEMSFRNQLHDTYVDDAGKFRLEIPLDSKASAQGVSDSSLDRGEMTLIVTGSLAKQQGLLVWGIAEFANDGCKSKLTMARQ